MRLVSQNRTVDCNYENGNLSIGCVRHEDGTEDVRVYYYSSASQRGTLLAEYTSEAKAIKAMEILHEQYMRWKCFSVLASGTCEHMEKSFSSEEFPKAVIEFCEMNIFQFPKDENVEVEDEMERS